MLEGLPATLACGPDHRRTSRLTCGNLSPVTEDLVSGAEIGRRLGVSREAVRKWASSPEREFPSPLARVGALWCGTGPP